MISTDRHLTEDRPHGLVQLRCIYVKHGDGVDEDGVLCFG